MIHLRNYFKKTPCYLLSSLTRHFTHRTKLPSRHTIFASHPVHQFLRERFFTQQVDQLADAFQRLSVTNLSVQKDIFTDEKVACIKKIKQIETTLRSMGVLSSEKSLEDFMQTNKLADKDESAFQALLRATLFLAKAGSSFYGETEVTSQWTRFLHHVTQFEVILGSPILTNAGRREKSVSACSIPPITLSKMTRTQIANVVGDYHSRGMGTGFSLDDVDDPVEMVLYLNQVAIKEVQRGTIERSVGNMRVLSINHPKVIEFIRVKRDNAHIKEWKFNLSVNLTDAFIKAHLEKKPFQLANGTFIEPQLLLEQIAENAHATGDPGLIFMDRINQLNRVPHVGTYKTVVPCGEVSLFEGEVCQFAYLNLISFFEKGNFSKERLKRAVHSIVLMLDNAIEANIERMPNLQSKTLISSNRRIGVGVCGLAEVLQAQGLPYDSQEGRQFAEDLLSFINFESKWASCQLAKERGAFPHFHNKKTRKELFIKPFAKHTTKFVSAKDWENLEALFEKNTIRNISTTILPPTGRSSLLAGVTGSIEPPFRLVVDDNFKSALQKQCQRYHYTGDLQAIYTHVQKTGSVQETDLPLDVKRIFKTTLEIEPLDHLKMTAACQKHVDEGISKTVNMPHNATINDVQKIFEEAYSLNLKGVTIYRDGCRTLQPKVLSMKQDAAKIIDSLYGPVELSPRLTELVQSPLLSRLKGVHQNGTNYLFDRRQSTSRFEHSVGTLILTKMLGGDESTQIAALLHDISHTAFSHVVDLVFANKNQNYHDQVRDKFLSTKTAKETLQKLSITEKELQCEKIPLVKGKNINVDRLDYCIRDLKTTNRIYQPQYSSIINNLTLNEQGEIVCKTVDTARLLFSKFLEANQEIYFDPKAEAVSLAVATILKKMLLEGFLNKEDFFTTDDEIIEKIKKSPFKSAFEKIGPNIQFSFSETPKTSSQLAVLRKLRFINPKIIHLPGALTDHCKESQEQLTSYLSKTPTSLYYYIPLVDTL